MPSKIYLIIFYANMKDRTIFFPTFHREITVIYYIKMQFTTLSKRCEISCTETKNDWK